MLIFPAFLSFHISNICSNATRSNYCTSKAAIFLMNQTFPPQTMDKVFNQPFKPYINNMRVSHIYYYQVKLYLKKLTFNNKSEWKIVQVLAVEEGLWVSEIISAFFLTWVPDGDEWSNSCSGRFTQGVKKGCQYALKRFLTATYNTKQYKVLPTRVVVIDCRFVNLLKPTGHVMHQPFNIQQLYVLPTLYLCVLYLSENKQRLVPLTA